MTGVTRISNAMQRGDKGAANELLPRVYEELRRLAARKTPDEPVGHTLQATALVHEAYVRLRGLENQSWKGKGQFFVAASEAMRRMLIDHVRKKLSLKRGGGHKRIPLDGLEMSADGRSASDDPIALDVVLERLSKRDPVKANLVKSRYFGDLTRKQAAKALGLSSSTAEGDCDYARSWLRLEMLRGRLRDSRSRAAAPPDERLADGRRASPLAQPIAVMDGKSPSRCTRYLLLQPGDRPRA